MLQDITEELKKDSNYLKNHNLISGIAASKFAEPTRMIQSSTWLSAAERLGLVPWLRVVFKNIDGCKRYFYDEFESYQFIKAFDAWYIQHRQSIKENKMNQSEIILSFIQNTTRDEILSRPIDIDEKIQFIINSINEFNQRHRGTDWANQYIGKSWFKIIRKRCPSFISDEDIKRRLPGNKIE